MAELSRRRMPAHLRGLFTGNAANNLIYPWLARSRQEIMGKINSLDKGEFLGHVENVVARSQSVVPLHPVESGRAVRIGNRGFHKRLPPLRTNSAGSDYTAAQTISQLCCA